MNNRTTSGAGCGLSVILVALGLIVGRSNLAQHVVQLENGQ